MKYRKSENWLDAAVQDEMLLMCSETGAFRSLNETGAFLWQQLDHPRAAPDLAASLAAEFAVTEAQALGDTEAWLADMAQEGIICAVDG
ncbi:PqqD family protein [Erythrobacter sp. CCH5-A1]|uniref:PqqD family protein n=1 Tax=Erythrobacter sp. CCH5-A1 TaxID=1768792 RepID=UPI00082F5A6D|nr:PqqD family protein [Erythrobacter sp. CCH5-A1]